MPSAPRTVPGCGEWDPRCPLPSSTSPPPRRSSRSVLVHRHFWSLRAPQLASCGPGRRSPAVSGCLPRGRRAIPAKPTPDGAVPAPRRCDFVQTRSAGRRKWRHPVSRPRPHSRITAWGLHFRVASIVPRWCRSSTATPQLRFAFLGGAVAESGSGIWPAVHVHARSTWSSIGINAGSALRGPDRDRFGPPASAARSRPFSVSPHC